MLQRHVIAKILILTFFVSRCLSFCFYLSLYWFLSATFSFSVSPHLVAVSLCISVSLFLYIYIYIYIYISPYQFLFFSLCFSVLISFSLCICIYVSVAVCLFVYLCFSLSLLFLCLQVVFINSHRSICRVVWLLLHPSATDDVSYRWCQLQMT